MQKKIFRSISLVFFGIVLFSLALSFSTSTLQAAPHIPHETPTATATATPTATPSYANASVTVTLPGGGDPVGGPGTDVQINGSGFAPDSNVNVYTTPDPAQCVVTNSGNLAPFTTRSRASVRGDGTFEVSAKWPDNANQPSTGYYVCILDPANGIAKASGRPFTIRQQPTINITPQQVKQGDKITIVGANWPGSQKLTITAVATQDPNANYQEEVNTNADGTFSKEIEVPKDAPEGSYKVDIVAASDQSIKLTKENAFVIKKAATPTPTVTPTPSPTPEVTPTPTPGNGGNSGGGSPLITYLIFGLGGLGVILVIIGLIMFLTYSRA